MSFIKVSYIWHHLQKICLQLAKHQSSQYNGNFTQTSIFFFILTEAEKILNIGYHTDQESGF